MDFAFTQDQIELRDGVRAFLEGTHCPEVLRRLDAEGGRDPAIWRGLVEMGLTGLIVPEAQGGLGLGLVEAALVAVELGRADVSEPIVDTALIAPRLIADEAQLAAIASGKLKVALAHPVNPWVADADQAGLVLGGAATRERLESADPLRRLFAVERAEADAVMLDLAALMAAAQLVGASERMLTLATEYAKDREQFGQPIGAFQAIKHHLASVAVALEFARPVLWRAAYALDHGHARAPIHVSHAKLAATDAAMLAAETAIQVHGAMGYTYEVDLHYWMKRAWALAGAWGDRAFHLRRLDDAVIGGAMAIGPDQTFETGMQHG
ncbi:MAG: acyl-CoA dehydrogenase family protein [Sphingomonas sp.]|uniref:acyl-CoA dehydrogenase family protein n=1 Tax=Sphingomonas sp. TaxID=28214 RepID=UPI001ACA6EF5|nr:acyl-CoA dehydrogenase family protein [Sphingomonas sp.]MBN8848103.1 acyl-CoA dehydrogenase family protein [Sphingomonas sp.]